MFDFGNANEGQRQAISTCDGPVLITAGPGTGKTFTLVQRAIYLIQEKGIAPEQIMMATFTEKAAKELITRITNELSDRNISVNLNEMYIGTFHSLCLRIIKEHLEFTRLKKNYRTLDSFDQNYIVFQRISKFREIPDFETVFPKGAWAAAQSICNYVNNLSEELVDAEALKADANPQIALLGKVLDVYRELLDEENLVDFASIQTEAYRLLKENSAVLKTLQDKLHYLMIDEYQDTNYIQEQIVFLLAGEKQNICVVGDDDQGLYRFRGATIRNILEFPEKFPKGTCKIIPLVVNYRSNKDIVDFYNKWMKTTSNMRNKFSWGKYRHQKTIEPFRTTAISSPAVIKISSKNDEEVWQKKILDFITALKESGRLADYNQIAFLFRSVRHERVIRLAAFLEANDINVYSPRSDMFFGRKEVKLALGALMIMFPKYTEKLAENSFKYLKPAHTDYYKDCIATAERILSHKENADFRKWVQNHAKAHRNLVGTTDYTYSGLLYQMFEFRPFKEILEVDMSSNVVNVRAARNLSLLSQIIVKYEYLHRIDVLTGEKIDWRTERFFNMYLRFQFDGGINEYEDDSEYAPSGCVSFLTIHQSKGMEFPIVIVGSLNNTPRTNTNKLMLEIEEKYFSRPAYEPHELMKFFDFWRLYYTAFSRAQDLLILTGIETNREPTPSFREPFGELLAADSEDFDINHFEFNTVKAVNLKDSFSFTSHIAVYETCTRQYKFYKELGFTPVRAGAMIFGMLVHATIEDIHKAVLRNESATVTEENVAKWCDTNYISISKSEHSYLAEPQRAAALNQILKYVKHQQNNWNVIQQAEADVSLIKPDYIVEGKIDLIRGENGTIEIVDFKSEKKPDPKKDKDSIKRYERQLHLYAHLVEERTGQKVSNMHLYYTGDDSGSPLISFPYEKSAVEETMASFDNTVKKIQRKDFSTCTDNPKVCLNCDFRYFCKKR